MKLLTCILCVLVLFACSGQQHLTKTASSAFAPHALEGCRGPNDSGCKVCCRAKGVTASSTKGSSWYNVTSSVDDCGDIPACASCSYRDATMLSELKIPASCGDCSAIKIGVDPCFSPQSCACLCSRAARLSARCPTSQ